MKISLKTYAAAVVLLAVSITGSAQDRRFRLGISAGIDLGATVPYPLSKAIGGGDKMSAVPKISPSFGVSAGYNFDPKWSANMELNYKTVAFEATIVSLKAGQKFYDNNGDAVVFRGQARMEMSFTMLEMPLYCRYQINKNNAVQLGGYVSYVINGTFDAHVVQGNIVSADTPGALPEVVKPADLPVQHFGPSLSSWDFGWTAGYERNITPRISMTARLAMGVKDIFKQDEKFLDYSMWQMRGTATVNYRIFK